MNTSEIQDFERKIYNGTKLSISSLLDSSSRSIWTCRILLFFFVIIQQIIPKFRKSPCFWHSVLTLGSMQKEKRQGYKIAITMSIHGNDKPWGHAWIMKNGKSVSAKPQKIKTAITKVGSSELCEYYVAVPADGNLLSSD